MPSQARMRKSGHCIPKAHFQRVVRELAREQMQREDATRAHRRGRMRWRKDALFILQTETEIVMKEALEQAFKWQEMSKTPLRKGMLEWIMQQRCRE